MQGDGDSETVCLCAYVSVYVKKPFPRAGHAFTLGKVAGLRAVSPDILSEVSFAV